MRWRTFFLCVLMTILTLLGLGAVFFLVGWFFMQPVKIVLAVMAVLLHAEPMT